MNISSTTYFWNILFNRKKPTIFKYLVSDIQYYGILQMHSIEKKCSLYRDSSQSIHETKIILN